MVAFPCLLPTHTLPLKVQPVPMENLNRSESSKTNEPVKQPKGVPSPRSQPTTQYHDKQLAHPCVDMLTCKAIDTSVRSMVGAGDVDTGSRKLDSN
jgi:hypothetical protein